MKSNTLSHGKIKIKKERKKKEHNPRKKNLHIFKAEVYLLKVGVGEVMAGKVGKQRSQER